jgi:hypothetical protein
MEILEQALAAASSFQPWTQDRIREVLARTATAAARGEFEPFKTSSIFDGTAENPAWLGEEPERLRSLMS